MLILMEPAFFSALWASLAMLGNGERIGMTCMILKI